MKIERVQPPLPAVQFSLTFSRDESWSVIAALREYAGRHPDAVRAEDWRKWGDDLDKEVRS